MASKQNFGCIECRCFNCGHEFIVPSLSEFFYGQFIIFTEKGTRYAFLDSFQDQVFDEVALIVKLALQNLNLSENQVAERFQHVFGAACDPLEGDCLHLYSKASCPMCLSRNLQMEGVDSSFYEFDIPCVSHTRWLNLNTTERAMLIRMQLQKQGLLGKP